MKQGGGIIIIAAIIVGAIIVGQAVLPYLVFGTLGYTLVLSDEQKESIWDTWYLRDMIPYMKEVDESIIDAIPDEHEQSVTQNTVCLPSHYSDNSIKWINTFSTEQKAADISNAIGLDGATHIHENTQLLEGYDDDGFPMYRSVAIGYMAGQTHQDFMNWYDGKCRS